MTIFIAIGIVVCLAGLYTRVGGRRFEEVLPLSLFSVVLMLYVAGMAGQLFMGRNVVLAVGVAAVWSVSIFSSGKNVPFLTGY